MPETAGWAWHVALPITLILVILWVLLISITAMVPYPRHRAAALFLLVVSVAILISVAVEYGLLYAALFFLAVASIYRRPLLYFLGWVIGRKRDEDQGKE